MSFGCLAKCVRLNADSLRTLFVGIVAGVVISSVSVLMLMVTDPKRVRITAEYNQGSQQQWYGSVEWAQTVLDRNTVVAQEKSRIQKKSRQRGGKPRVLCWVMTQPNNHQAKYLSSV